MGKCALYINGEKTDDIELSGDINEIMSLLKCHKIDPNHSIFGIYNGKLNELDILFGKDDINSAYLLSNVIKNYHGDLLDIDIYGITNTSYMNIFLNFVRSQINILRMKNKMEKGNGLIKRDK